ncbi:MAG: hypothetical protein H6509_05665 [Bryobacterales bacterium]|nr:hypothetical protein [Acidobacteriota bacterium]MCB9384081.1 hypothetical protein [Bryobacterales bacterium]
MQCPTCVETTVTAFCRHCGKGVCPRCAQSLDGVPHCAECAEVLRAAREANPPRAAEPVAPPPALGATAPSRVRPAYVPDADAPHPVLSGVLGFVPGLGAVYNGQYVKGLIHVILFGLLMTIATNVGRGLEAMFVPLIAAFYLYMPIEAVRTAQAMRRGERVDELSGLVGTLFRDTARSPAAGVAVIAAGIVLLLFSLEVFRLEQIVPYWPLLLIALGIYWLYTAIRPRDPEQSAAAPDEARE